MVVERLGFDCKPLRLTLCSLGVGKVRNCFQFETKEKRLARIITHLL